MAISIYPIFIPIMHQGVDCLGENNPSRIHSTFETQTELRQADETRLLEMVMAVVASHRIEYVAWKAGFRTGMDNPIMRTMSAKDLVNLAHAHVNCNTSHDFGIAAAAMVLARKAAVA